MQFNTKSIQLFDHNISYYDLNVDKEQTILMVHGNSSSKNCFLPLLEHLKSFRIIAFDLLGHGDSDVAKDMGFYTAPFYSRLTAEFVKALNLENFILAGHSLGGHIAIESIPLLEDRLDRVFVWGTPPIAKAEDLGRAFLPNPVLAPIFKPESSREELKALAVSYIENTSFHESFIDDYFKTDPQVRVEIFQALAQGNCNDEVEIVEKATVPVTLVYGTEDPLINTEYIEDICEQVCSKNSMISLKTIPSSHSTQIDDSEVLAEMIKNL